MADTEGPEDPAVVARMYVLLAGANSLEAFLDELAGLAADEVDRGLSCGVAVRLTDRPMSVASSDDLAERLDEVQYSAGEGPAVDAISTGQPVEVHDLDVGEQWSAWRARGRDNGVRKSLSVPLTAGDTTLGALNTYSTSAEPFTDADREATERFATRAARALAVATRLSEHTELASHLEAELKARGVVDQATGVLMAREHCTADEAAVRLKTSAHERGVTVLDVAEDIVRSVVRPRDSGPDPG
jgi:GAF domain-containing protein